MPNSPAGLAMSQPTPKRRVILTHPPASSPWHLPAGTSLLTSILRRDGHDVIQRYGHISGLEYVLRAQDREGTDKAIQAIQSPSSTIEELYEARKALEAISAGVVSPDSFRVERNNVRYTASRYMGTILSLLGQIRTRRDSIWYDYFAKVEVPLAQDYRPDLYGISINDEHQIVPGFILAAMIKEAFPDTLVVIGGNVWSRVRKAFKLPWFAELFDFCDVIVDSEGFEPLTRLAKTLDPWHVPGVVWQMFGKVLVNKTSEQAVEFTTLPTPHYDGGARAWCPDFVMPLYTSSNCIHQCSYCAISGGSDSFLGRTRFLSPMQIAMQMKELSRYGNRFDITDETFSIGRQQMLGAALRQIAHTATWQCYLTITQTMRRKEVCQSLYDAGCRAVQLGLETLSSDSLTQENKKWNTPEHYGEILRNLTEVGIQVHVFIIVGIPGEPMSQMLKWLPFIEKYGDYMVTIKPARYRLTRMSPEEQDGIREDLIEALPDVAPLRLNRDFRYRDTNGRSTRKDVEATLVLIDEACRRHELCSVTSTIPWWANRGRYTRTELSEMAKELPEEPPHRHLKDSVRRATWTVKAELGGEVRFGNYDDVLKFFRPLL